MRVRSLLLPLLLLLLCPMLAEGQIKVVSQAPFTGGVLTSQITLPAGSGTATYKPSGVIERKYTSTGTTNVTTEETLWTYTLPANTLNADGQAIRVTAYGVFAANANTKTVRFYFGTAASTVNDATTAPNNTAWTTSYIITRTGAAAQTRSKSPTVAGALQGGNFSSALTSDTTAAIVIKITGQNGTASANDIVLHGVLVEYLP